MRPCHRVGLDITWRCNWRCRHCFYLRNPSFHEARDEPLNQVKEKIDRAVAAGLDHAVLTGYGEPTLCPNMLPILMHCKERGLATSMITNGSAPLTVYENAFALGLDHLHISSHGCGDVLRRIARHTDAWITQTRLKAWLRAAGLPYRSNVTMQQMNYATLPALARDEIERGVFHFVFLGFLPHYEWPAHLDEVVVHPAKLRPLIESSAKILLDAGVYFTIRYQPLCHLDPEFWPHVTNANMVFFDPWEWNHTLNVRDEERLWADAVELGDSVAVQGAPCSDCVARPHCGGWNRTYAGAFDGAGLSAITEVPAEYADVWAQRGGLHDQNPVNQLTGTIRA